MLSFFRRAKAVKATPFSEFIREASAREKKRIYGDVLEKATEDQALIIRRARPGRNPA